VRLYEKGNEMKQEIKLFNVVVLKVKDVYTARSGKKVDGVKAIYGVVQDIVKSERDGTSYSIDNSISVKESDIVAFKVLID
jgi:hypothetical protein